MLCTLYPITWQTVRPSCFESIVIVPPHHFTRGRWFAVCHMPWHTRTQRNTTHMPGQQCRLRTRTMATMSLAVLDHVECAKWNEQGWTGGHGARISLSNNKRYAFHTFIIKHSDPPKTQNWFALFAKHIANIRCACSPHRHVCARCQCFIYNVTCVPKKQHIIIYPYLYMYSRVFTFRYFAFKSLWKHSGEMWDSYYLETL